MYDFLFELPQTLSDYGLILKVSFQIHHKWLATAIVSIFALVNAIRILAYIPQILRAAADTNGASAISYTTWGLFFISHLTTIAYAVVVLGDLILAFIFLGNALACLGILGVTFFKRRRFSAKIDGPSRRQRLPAHASGLRGAWDFGATIAILVGALLLAGAALL